MKEREELCSVVRKEPRFPSFFGAISLWISARTFKLSFRFESILTINLVVLFWEFPSWSRKRHFHEWTFKLGPWLCSARTLWFPNFGLSTLIQADDDQHSIILEVLSEHVFAYQIDTTWLAKKKRFHDASMTVESPPPFLAAGQWQWLQWDGSGCIETNPHDYSFHQ